VNGDLLPVGESLARFLCRAGRIERIQGIGQFMPGESNNRFVHHNHAHLSPNYGLSLKVGNLFLGGVRAGNNKEGVRALTSSVVSPPGMIFA